MTSLRVNRLRYGRREPNNALRSGAALGVALLSVGTALHGCGEKFSTDGATATTTSTGGPGGTTSTATSTTTTGAGGGPTGTPSGTAGGAGGSGPGGSGPVTCADQYASVVGLSLWCIDQGEVCEFVYNGVAFTCSQVCEANGGECLYASSSYGNCDPVDDFPCTESAGTYVICGCSHGCGAGPPCDAGRTCVAGVCE